MWFLYIILAVFALVNADDKHKAVPAIIGGIHAPSGIFRWQVSLRSIEEGNRHFCGGSIIGEKWILTSARCATTVRPSDIQVLVGTSRLSSGGTTYKVNSTIIHKNFTQRPLQNDIALIKVAKPMEFNKQVQPIQLDDKLVKPNNQTIVTGWGYENDATQISPDGLRVTQVTVLDDKDCKQKLERRRFMYREGINMCSLDRDRGVCKGDDGGPVIKDVKLVAIVSFSYTCTPPYPSIYTRVSAYLPWIRDQVVKK